MNDQNDQNDQNGQNGQSVRENAAEHNERHIDPAIEISFNDLEKLRSSFGIQINEVIEEIEKSLLDVIEQRDHARSVLPGAAHPTDCAMGQINKMADIAHRVHKEMLPKLFAEFGTIAQVVHFGLNAAQKAQIQCAVSINEREFMSRNYETLSSLVTSIAEFVGFQIEPAPDDCSNDADSDPEMADFVDKKEESVDDGKKSQDVKDANAQEAGSA